MKEETTFWPPSTVLHIHTKPRERERDRQRYRRSQSLAHCSAPKTSHYRKSSNLSVSRTRIAEKGRENLSKHLNSGVGFSGDTEGRRNEEDDRLEREKKEKGREEIDHGGATLQCPQKKSLNSVGFLNAFPNHTNI